MSSAQQYPLADVLGWSAAAPAWASGAVYSLHDATATPGDAVTATFLAHCLAQSARVVFYCASHPIYHYTHILRKMGAASLDTAVTSQQLTVVDVAAAAAVADAAGPDSSAGARALAFLLKHITSAAKSMIK